MLKQGFQNSVISLYVIEDNVEGEGEFKNEIDKFKAIIRRVSSVL